MGRPLTLEPVLDEQVQAYLRKGAGAITTDVAIAAAEGIVCKKGGNLLAKYGGHIALTRDWAHSLLDWMGFIKRKAKTKAKVSVEDFEKLKAFDIETFTSLEENT